MVLREQLRGRVGFAGFILKPDTVKSVSGFFMPLNDEVEKKIPPPFQGGGRRWLFTLQL